MPVPLAPRRCARHGQLDTLSDHRAACATAGALATRTLPLSRVHATKLALGSPATSVWPTGTSTCHLRTSGASRSSPTAWRCGTGRSSPLMPQSCPPSHSEATPVQTPQPGCAVCAAARRKRHNTPNSDNSAMRGGAAVSYLASRLAAGSAPRQPTSCAFWRGTVPPPSPSSSDPPRPLPGSHGGRQSCGCGTPAQHS